MERLDIGRIVVALVGMAALTPRAPAAGQGCPNPIVCENLLAGNPKSDWQIDGVAGNGISDVDEALEGFTDRMSYVPGGTVNFKVSTDATSYRIEIFRLGYYGGLGARRVATVNPSVPLPQAQPNCFHDTNPSVNLIDCGNWAVSASWVIPSGAVPGVYVAKLIRQATPANLGNHMFFIVRPKFNFNAVIFQLSDTTWQAYNWWGDRNVPNRPRYSLYFGPAGYNPSNPDISGRARKVSYNRPFAQAHLHPNEIMGNNLFLVEHSMIRWLERNGYDVAYISGSETPGMNFTHNQVLLAAGHDEYWSGDQRANVEQARDTEALNLVFFAGNEVYWKTRWEADQSGVANRTLVTYKEPFSLPFYPDPLANTWTGLWRDVTRAHAKGDLTVKPENLLTGTAWAVASGGAEKFRVSADEGKLRLWRNTPLASLVSPAVATLNMPLGNEWDEDWDNGFRPAGLVRLSTSTHFISPGYVLDSGANIGGAGPGVAEHHLTLYRAPSGALVFGAGSFGLIMGLDHDNEHTRYLCGPGMPCPCPVPADCTDPSFQQAVVNLLADMGVQPASLQAGLVPATQSADQAGPTIPPLTPPATVLANTTLTLEGTATDTGGGIVAGVEVSADAGLTWHAATRRAGSGYPWRFNWTPGPATGNAQIRIRAIDDSGNIGPAHHLGITVAANSQPTIVVHAAGTGAGAPAAAAFPAMELVLNNQVVRTFHDVQGKVGKDRLDPPHPKGEFERFGYSQAAALPSIKNIKVRFANEAPANTFGEDRNLYVQKVTLNGVDRVPLVDTVGFYMPTCAAPPAPPCANFRLKFLNFWGPHDLQAPYGIAGDVPIAGDWNNDDLDTVGVFRSGTFFLADQYGGATAQTFAFGLAGDVPIAGDWNGNGVDTVGVFRAGTFYLRDESGNAVSVAYGLSSDIPVVGDWNGDGIDTIGVFRDGWFYLRNSNTSGFADVAIQFGQTGDKPIAGDWDWNGADSVGVFRWSATESEPTVFLRNTLTSGPAEQTLRAGASGDHVVAGHWRRQ